MIVYTIIQILLTLAGAGVIGYSIYLTIQVSGDKLLTLDSELGYRYATSADTFTAGSAVIRSYIQLSFVLTTARYTLEASSEKSP